MEVPIHFVDHTNWPFYEHQIRRSIVKSLFVAIDMEFSGIGDNKEMNSLTGPAAYAYFKGIVDSRCIVSLGLACFRKQEETKEKKWMQLHVDVYQILLHPEDDFKIDTNAGIFLAERGFDFNALFLKGMTYSRSQTSSPNHELSGLRGIIHLLIHSRIPLAVHNGGFDLAFLVAHLYTDCMPPTLQAFLSLVHFLWSLPVESDGDREISRRPANMFDTKFLVNYKLNFPASYLQFAFYWCCRQNYERAGVGERFFKLDVGSYDGAASASHGSKKPKPGDRCAPAGVSLDLDDGPGMGKSTLGRQLCQNHMKFGHCRKGVHCKYSHNITQILDHMTRDKQELNKKQHENHKTQSAASANSPQLFLVDQAADDASSKPKQHSTKLPIGQMHNAGVDAFMTGVVLADCLFSIGGEVSELTNESEARDLNLDERMTRLRKFGNVMFVPGSKEPVILNEHYEATANGIIDLPTPM